MSRSSYTASERRGVLAIAIIALLIIAAGIALGFCGRRSDSVPEVPTVVETPELIDTTAKNTDKTQTVGKKASSKTKSKGNATKQQKTYRRRSPLDEPV